MTEEEKGFVDAQERLLQMLSEQKKEFDEHRKEWKSYLNDWNDHKDTVEEIHSNVIAHGAALNVIKENMPHLGQLPVIASSLSDIKDKLISPLTSDNKMPTSVAVIMLKIAFAMIMFLGIALVVILIRETKKDFNVGGEHGITMSDPQKKPDNLPNEK